VTQPRSPCFKLNYHFGISDMSAAAKAGKTGWLYRVVLAGRFQRMRRWSWFPA
jgi:MOSC domain-containing protein YiiM